MDVKMVEVNLDDLVPREMPIPSVIPSTEAINERMLKAVEDDIAKALKDSLDKVLSDMLNERGHHTSRNILREDVMNLCAMLESQLVMSQGLPGETPLSVPTSLRELTAFVHYVRCIDHSLREREEECAKAYSAWDKATKRYSDLRRNLIQSQIPGIGALLKAYDEEAAEKIARSKRTRRKK